MSSFKHGGTLREYSEKTGLPQDQILDFSANINPLGPPEWMEPLIKVSIDDVLHYPDPECLDLKLACARRYNVSPQNILIGNGSTELLFLIPRALGLRRAIIPTPSYIDYATAARSENLEVKFIDIKEADGFRVDLSLLKSQLEGGEIVFLGHPNNPTGVSLDVEATKALVSANPETVFVIDEAFLDLTESIKSFCSEDLPNIIVLVSLTKTFSIPGLRLGIALAKPAWAVQIRKAQAPWSVNALAQRVGKEAVEDIAFVQRSREYVRERRIKLESALNSINGLKVFPSQTNFLLLKINRWGMDCQTLSEQTLAKGLAIRPCANFRGLGPNFFRVAVRSEEENETLFETLNSIFTRTKKAERIRTARAIMFQGTSSNAGKSVLTAAFCRIFLQDGYAVAPFKSQNMSLNSFVTLGNEEIGRAQALQAQACRLEPDARMNPILLKPNSDTGSQVIVMGKPVSNMNVEQYIKFKPVAFEHAVRAFDSLAEEYDVVVIEGAGSPAEINLKSHDIVNMTVAQYARAPVIIVGDIDRGGVFASFVGTMELLANWEKRLVKGFMINRFRGREELLGPAIEFTQRATRRNVLGIVPYIQGLGLPEEDSVSFKSDRSLTYDLPERPVDIAIVDLPHISNFTDLDAFKIEPDVRLRIVRTVNELREPDAIILPGSKNVIKDLDYLNSTGMSDAIKGLFLEDMTEIVGICGGFQMIGETIQDSYGLESDLKSIRGLGFLRLTTEMEQEKTLKRVRATHIDSGNSVFGYEIHHGQTISNDAIEAFCDESLAPLGYMSPSGLAWGTYIHGVFDADAFRRWFINRIRKRKGLAPLDGISSTYDIEPSLDRLADIVRKSVRMNDIYRSMGL
jgi:adenosylcobyric acid synthase